MPALRTDASGCGSSGVWATPTTTEAKSDTLQDRAARGRQVMLCHEVRQSWPTATAGDATSARNATSGRSNPNSMHHAGTTLTDAVVPPRARAGNWPTPSAAVRNDSESVETFHARRILLKEKHHNGNGAGEPLEIAAKRAWPTPSANEDAAGTPDSGGPHGLDGGADARAMLGSDKPVGALNPDWVEALMGWPLGWSRREPLPELVWPATGGGWPNAPNNIRNWPTPTVSSTIEQTPESWDARAVAKAAANPNLNELQRSLSTEAKRNWPAPPGAAQHPWEPPRVGVGIKDRAKRLKAIGNGQVPLTVVLAWRILS